MQVQRWKKAGAIAALGLASIYVASWWIGQRPYLTPGTHEVFRMDSTPGAMAGFLVSLGATVIGIPALLLCFNDRRFSGEAGRAVRFCAGIFVVYLGAAVLASVLTPRTIVSLGDGYCYDLWCVEVRQGNATPVGHSILYTAQIRIFSDANQVPTYREKDFLYGLDDQGRRFPVFQRSSVLPPLDLTVNPGESVKTSLSFLAPANVRNVYLTGSPRAMPWVYLYFGSDLAPFHRRTLLRVL